ncbi:MAG TPA: hypothetical protein VEG34_16110 [Thermoanaerobaculia bacterium]|nr:hypothetical protein [Thermoanaerobaculia bacterium]
MAPRIPLPGPHHKPKRYLKEYGFERQRRKIYGTILLVVISIGVATGLGFFLNGRKVNEHALNGTEVALFLLTLGALAFGYQQWREAREEASLERYYERLEYANKRRGDSPESVHKILKDLIPELADDDAAVLMYVFVELDNLEYAACKYRLGYMRPSQALRALRTFEGRCLSPDFRRIAYARVSRCADYHPYTTMIVTKVCNLIENDQSITGEKVAVPPRPAKAVADLVPPVVPAGAQAGDGGNGVAGQQQPCPPGLDLGAGPSPAPV